MVDKFKKRSKESIDDTLESREARERDIEIIKNADIDKFFMSKTGYNLQHHLNKNKIKPNATLTSYFTSAPTNVAALSKPIE